MRAASRQALSAATAMVLLPLVLAVPAAASPERCGTGSVTTSQGVLSDGATYVVQCPATWNGTLFLYSHGYVIPGLANLATDAGDSLTRQWLLQHHYALAGSSYATTGWAVSSALVDQIATLDRFDRLFGKPRRTIAWGHSLGGMITAGLVQEHPSDFAGALPFCGVLAGGVASWNTALDAAVAFRALLAPPPELKVVDITDEQTDLGIADTALAAAQTTREGRARIALVAALADIPGWFLAGAPRPAATDYDLQEQNQDVWLAEVDFPFAFNFRGLLEAQAGGNFSWDNGVDFASQLAHSVDRNEVEALYRAAGLNLAVDLGTLQRAPKIKADPSAVRYLEHNISFTGRISVPVLTVHTTGDGLVVPENEQAYRAAVEAAGDQRLLRQLFVDRAGHCSFTSAETIEAIKVLLGRIATGHWNDSALQPARLNAAASSLGGRYNVIGTSAVAPAFLAYEPPPYPRSDTLPA